MKKLNIRRLGGLLGIFICGSVSALPLEPTGLTDGVISVGPGSEPVEMPSSGSITLDSGSVPDPDTSDSADNVVTISGYDISVDGDLFLDLSVFGNGSGVSLDDVQLTAGFLSINLLGPPMVVPDTSSLTVYSVLEPVIDHAGDLLLFSPFPVQSSVFEASGGIYIGDYAAFTPVPSPASAVLLAVALIGGALFGYRRH